MGKRKRGKGQGTGGVGYGRPPRATQFKPGQSGNPKGRPKGSLNLETVLGRALAEKVVIVENGRRRRLSKLQIAVKQLVNKAAAGDPRATQLLLKPSISDTRNLPISEISEADQRREQSRKKIAKLSSEDLDTLLKLIDKMESGEEGG